MITKEETREILSIIGSKDCKILINIYTVDGKYKATGKFTDSDEALKWVVDELDKTNRIIITII